LLKTVASRVTRASLCLLMTFTFGCIEKPSANVDPALDKFAISILAKLQHDAFARRNEACGYIYKMNDSLKHTPIAHGKIGYCDSSPEDVPQGGTLLASFHNHGGFHEDYDSEVPTVDDLDMDRLDHVVGYLATPGGRVWRIGDGFARQLCRGCVPWDPDHDEESFPPVSEGYTRKQLIEREKIATKE